jgi:hypothetical protein
MTLLSDTAADSRYAVDVAYADELGSTETMVPFMMN